MERSFDIISEFHKLIEQGDLPEEVNNLLLEVKWKVDKNVLEKIHWEKMLNWECFNHILFLIGCVVCWIDSIDIWNRRINI